MTASLIVLEIFFSVFDDGEDNDDDVDDEQEVTWPPPSLVQQTLGP